ncbi:GRANULINS domain-containing protein [Caerostris darwini]|uniref:GRANULINS domain-containing protein n=1 Tax=Caerostris darwini TaxID=1538125 RepID=A0AAV4MF05_9ARAC|nr:GRANULINS domain-containing protein [Caerostris darwini]
MKVTGMLLVVLLVGLSSALPDGLMSAALDMMKPEYVALHKNLESMGIEMCPDKLHLCPATADCCQKDDGKWDCCPKAAAIEAQCCIQSGFKRVCCIGNIPRCRWDGCYFG